MEVDDFVRGEMKVCIVSSCGGHLTEVRCLAKAYAQHEYFYVLNDNALLPDDMKGKTLFIRHAERNWLVLLNFIEAFRILRQHKPDVILSTGAGPVVPFAVLVKYSKVKVIYVETITRVHSPSMTGRIMYYLSDEFFYQWKSLKGFFPKGRYLGTLL